MNRRTVFATLFFATGCAAAFAYGMGKWGAEKRKSRRREFHASALVKHGDEAFSGEIRNISKRGAYLATQSSPAVNDQIELTIHFEHEANKLEVTVPCKVARIDEQGIGLVSSYIDPRVLSRLKLIFTLHKEDAKTLLEEFCTSL